MDGDTRTEHWRFDWLQAADGAALRIARWPGAGPRGVCLLLGGRTEFIEKYEEAAGELAARGFAVWSMDWRGQGLSVRDPELGERGHADDYAVWVADLARLVEHAAGDRPPVVLAHSMGAHITLRYMAEHPGRIAAAILTAPMIEILSGAWPHWLARAIALRALRRGQARAYAIGQRDYGAMPVALRRAVLNSDPERFDQVERVLQARPELRIGGVTWGWLAATLRSSRILRRRTYLRGIQAPVMLATAGRELLVSNRATRGIARMLPRATRRHYRAARHELLIECDAVRTRFWADVDGFLDASGL